jgi:hypothetical protein
MERRALTSAQASCAIMRSAEGRAWRQSMMTKPITILSVLIIATLTIGVALAGRLEQRAQQDRLSFGGEPTELSGH